MKILHLADIHASDKDYPEVEKCLNYIVDLATEHQPDLIINAGDTFDSQNVKLDSWSAKLIFDVFARLADIAPVVTIIGTPSHDGMAAEVLRHVRAKNPIWVSTKPESLRLCDLNGSKIIMPASDSEKKYNIAIISTIPQPTKQFLAESAGLDIKTADINAADAISNILTYLGMMAEQDNCPHILAGHFQVGGAYVSDSQQLTGQEIEISKDQIGLAMADIVCMGHIHLSQKIGKNIWYSGSIYQKNFGEKDDKGVYIYEIKGRHNRPAAAFYSTPHTKRLTLTDDITVKPYGDVVSSYSIMDRLTQVNGRAIRVEIKTWQDEADIIDRDEITAALSGAASVDIKIIRVPRENVRSAKILKLSTLRDKIAEMAALRNESVATSILTKADMLEHMESNRLIAESVIGVAA